MESNGADSARSSRSRIGWITLVIVVVLLGSSLFVRTSTVIEPRIVAGTMVGFVVVIAGLVCYRAVTASPSGSEIDSDASDAHEGEQSAANGDSSVWNAIPSWQYGGRHVESGGLARGEQEQALRDIQQQAEELSDDPTQNEP